MARRLPGEHHQGGVENDGKEEMASHQPSEREDGREVRDPPRLREAVDASDDKTDGTETEDEGSLEAFDQSGDLLDEIDFFHFLRCRAPSHVDAKEVA